MQCQNLLNLQQVHSQSEILAEEVVENGHDSEKGKIMINNSKLGNRGVSLLITIVPLFEIKELLLWDNMIGDCGVKILAKASWPSLKSLRLAENNITGKGVKSLVNGAFCNISELSLYKNPLGNEGIKQLVKGQWKSLRTILLNNCQISNEAAIWLTFGNWKSLSSMNLGSNCISQAGSLCLLNINKQHNSPFSVLLFCNKFRPSVSKLLKTATPQNWKISA